MRNQNAHNKPAADEHQSNYAKWYALANSRIALWTMGLGEREKATRLRPALFQRKYVNCLVAARARKATHVEFNVRVEVRVRAALAERHSRTRG